MRTVRARAKIAGVVAVMLLAAAIGGALYAPDDAKPAKVEAIHLLTAPLAGEPGKEVDIQIYTFPPGSAVPWHIHPGAHEFDYPLDGTLMLEEQGKPPHALKAGEVYYLAPDVVHRGWNASKTEPAKVYVVRIKPVGAPLVKVVEPEESQSAAPAPDNYPDETP